MVSCLSAVLIILFCIAFFIFSITKRSNAKTNSLSDYYRKLAKISQKIVLLLLPPMIIFTSLTLFTAAQQLLRPLHTNPPEYYTADNIRIWSDGLYSERADPAVYDRITKNEEPETSAFPEPEPPILPEPEPETAPAPAVKVPAAEPAAVSPAVSSMASYDYSVLEIFGGYSFGETITPKDLEKMEKMYGDYWSEKKYQQIWDTEVFRNISVQDALDNIARFDSDVRYNSSTLTAADYYEDARDKLFLYEYGEDSDIYLELSAISAEGAAELENVIATGGYQTLFVYIRRAAARFSCVLAYDYQPYISGSEADVKYRIGKLLCKPAINLQELALPDMYYSLCSSYTVLKDAFYQSMPDDRYYMELAYHYLLVTSNIFQYMEPEDRGDIYQEALAAYCRFRDRGEEDPQNPVYAAYREKAENIAADLNSQSIAGGFYQIP